MLQVIAGYDPTDTASTDTPVPGNLSTITASTASLHLGIPRDYFYDELDPEIEAALEHALVVLKKITKSQQDVPPLAGDGAYSSWTDAYGSVLSAEAYAYHKDYMERTPELYQPPTLKRLRAGAEVTAAKYIQSRRELERTRRCVRHRGEAAAAEQVEHVLPAVRLVCRDQRIGGQIRKADRWAIRQGMVCRQQGVRAKFAQQDASKMRRQAEIIGQAKIDGRIAKPPPKRLERLVANDDLDGWIAFGEGADQSRREEWCQVLEASQH